MFLQLSKQALVAAICGLAFVPNMSIAAITMQQTAATWKKPAFCKNLDCPHFEVSNTTDAYEVRRYAAAVWGSTKLEGLSREHAAGTGFMRLFRYIQGENVEGSKIAMTAPVTTLTVPGEGPLCSNTFTVSFYAPDKYQGGQGPPAPTNVNVFVETRPELNVAVIAYGGFSSDQLETKKAAELKSLLDRDGIKHRDDRYWVAGYDSPFTFHNRHNEVWIEVEW